MEAEEPTLVAVGPAQTEWLRRELPGDAQEGLEFVPMHEVGRNPARIIPLWRDFVDENAGRPVRGIGESVWPGRSRAELEECDRHEALLSLAFPEDPDFLLLCPYDGALPGAVLERVAATHRCVDREGAGRVDDLRGPRPDCFGGELPPAPARPEMLRFGLTGLAEVRHKVAAAAERAGMDACETADLVIAAGELAANSVMHGGGTGTLRLWRENDSLVTEVEDRGRIEEPLVGRQRPGITQEGGRGLWLANLLCDLVQIRSGDRGTVVRLHSAVPERAPGSGRLAAVTDPRAEAAPSQV